MFSILTLVIKFDCLFLTIYQSFHLFLGFIFDKLAPPPLNIFFKRCFKSLFNPLQSIKQSQKNKNVVFFPFSILVDMPMGGEAIAPAPPLATLLALIKFEVFESSNINKFSKRNEFHCSKIFEISCLKILGRSHNV